MTSTTMSEGRRECEKCKDLGLKYDFVLESKFRLERRLDEMEEQLAEARKQSFTAEDDLLKILGRAESSERRSAEMEEQLAEARKQSLTAKDDLLKLSGRVASWEREFVGYLLEYAKKPRTKPGEYVARMPDVLGKSLMADGFTDLYAKFLFHCQWLHVHMAALFDGVDFCAVYSLLETERNTFGDARWNAPYHAKLAELLAKEGLSTEDWDITVWDARSSSSELSEKEIELLARLVVMYEKFYSDFFLDEDDEEDSPDLQY